MEKNKELLLAAKHKNTSFKAIKTGDISITYEYGGLIASYIKELRAIGLLVYTSDIILYEEIVKSFENIAISSLRSLAFRFIKRMGFCLDLLLKLKLKLKKILINMYLNFI